VPGRGLRHKGAGKMRARKGEVLLLLLVLLLLCWC
jgi:hypothetical protein